MEYKEIAFETDQNITQLLPEVEKKMNNFIKQGCAIATYPDEKEPGKYWWQCADWKMPCGGTHVRNAGEIGAVKLKRRNLGAGKERVEITL